MDIKALIANVEKLVYGEGDAAGKNQKIDEGTKEVSIFNQELNKLVRTGELSEEDAKNVFNQELGLELHSKSRANAPKKAADATIIINNNININIYVSVDIEDAINDFIKNLDIETLVGKLIEAMKNNTTAIEEFIVGMVNTYAENMNLQLGDVQELLKQILERLAAVEQDVGTIKGDTQAIYNLLKQQFDFLQSMGLDVKDFIAKFEQYAEKNQVTQEEQNTILGNIYDAISKFSDKWGNIEGDFKAMFNTLISKIDKNGANLESVIALLEAIKADTSENNEIGKAVLKEVTDGNTKILEYLDKIYKKLGDLDNDVKLGFENLALQIVNNGDNIEKKMNDLEALLVAIKGDVGDVKANTDESKNLQKEILEAIKNMDITVNPNVVVDLTEIVNAINANGGKLDDLKALLAAIKQDTGGIKADVAEIKKTEAEILEVVKTLGADFAAGFADLLVEVKAGNMKLDDLKALLASIKQDTGDIKVDVKDIKETELEILEVLKKYGADLSSAFTELLVRVKTGNIQLDDLKTILEGIKQENGDIRNTVVTVIEGAKQELIDAIEGVVDWENDYNGVLKDILDAIGNLNSSYINNGNNDTKLLELLANILKAIRELELVCNCGDNDEGKHEGIQTTGTLLMANIRMLNNPSAATGISDVTNKASAPKGPRHDLSGRIISDGDKHRKGIYIKDGKKYIAK